MNLKKHLNYCFFNFCVKRTIFKAFIFYKKKIIIQMKIFINIIILLLRILKIRPESISLIFTIFKKIINSRYLLFIQVFRVTDFFFFFFFFWNTFTKIHTYNIEYCTCTGVHHIFTTSSCKVEKFPGISEGRESSGKLSSCDPHKRIIRENSP